MLAIKNTVYEVVETTKYITMYESYQNKGKSYRMKIASATSWRRDAVKGLMKKLGIEDKTDDVEKAMRVYIAIKVLNSIKRPEQRYKLVDVVLNLPPEEVFFWAWKLSSTKNGAYAFRVLYGLV